MTPSKTSLFALASAGAVICSTQAIAQTAEPATERAVGLSEIVVTAERREQRLQDVPITISAADEAVIKAQAIRDSMDIARVAPGVIINKSIGAATPFVRGVGIISSGFANELPVAVYLDEFYLATPAAGVFSLNNIQRVEVLKGPQGTLFGRNAQGGVIHVITKAPSQEQHLDANVGYGNYNTFSGDLYATGAVTEDLALSLAASGSHQGDGWGTNVFTGSDIFKTEGYSLQGRALWTPSDRTRVDLIALFDSRMTDVGIQYGMVPGSVGVDGTTFIDDFDVANRQDRKAKANQSLLGIKFSHDLGFARLVSLTGRSDIHSKFSFNQSGLPGQPIAGRTANETELDGKAYAFTQEIQLLSPSNSSVSWILGGFYLDSRDELDQIVHGTCVGLVCAGPVPVLIQGRQDTRSYAAFGQATFEVLPRTRMTLGLRYTEDEKSTEESRALPAPGFANSPTAIPAIQLARPGLPYPGNPNGIEPNKTWSKLTWRASVDHKLTEDIMIFASANRGYKAGTYNITGFTNPPALLRSSTPTKSGSRAPFWTADYASTRRRTITTTRISRCAARRPPPLLVKSCCPTPHVPPSKAWTSRSSQPRPPN